MFSEQLAIMLFLAATHWQTPSQGPIGPVMEDTRHAMIRAEGAELVAALEPTGQACGYA